MKQHHFLFLISFVLALIFIGPFLFITKYTYLSADDFCRASADFSNYFKNVSTWYFEHNGRFVNSLFSYLPVYDNAIYKTTLALSMIFFWLTIYLFISRISNFYHFFLKKEQAIFLSVLFSS